MLTTIHVWKLYVPVGFWFASDHDENLGPCVIDKLRTIAGAGMVGEHGDLVDAEALVN